MDLDSLLGDSRLPDRFWRKVTTDPATGCWLWTASTGTEGYGQFRWDGTMRRAHVVAFSVLIQPVPDGLQLDHRCHRPEVCPGGITCPHRRCVRLADLTISTHRDNNLRGNSAAARHARQTECIRGHAFDAANTGRRRNGARYCRACNALYARERRSGIKTTRSADMVTL